MVQLITCDRERLASRVRRRAHHHLYGISPCGILRGRKSHHSPGEVLEPDPVAEATKNLLDDLRTYARSPTIERS
jgi:hypothetical protein